MKITKKLGKITEKIIKSIGFVQKYDCGFTTDSPNMFSVINPKI